MRELKLVLYLEDDPDIQMVAQLPLDVVGGPATLAGLRKIPGTAGVIAKPFDSMLLAQPVRPLWQQTVP